MTFFNAAVKNFAISFFISKINVSEYPLQIFSQDFETVDSMLYCMSSSFIVYCNIVIHSSLGHESMPHIAQTKTQLSFFIIMGITVPHPFPRLKPSHRLKFQRFFHTPRQDSFLQQLSFVIT